jgi:protocatechuate 3,4-dioxygenase beta subunit
MKKSNRRTFFLRLLGGFGVLLSGAWIFRRSILKGLFFNAEFDTSLLNAAPTKTSDYCILTSQQTDGPFFFPSPQRRNIVEDRSGKNLSLQFQVIKHPDCQPLKDAVVEIWHCDAEGTYSGYPEEITHDIWKEAMFMKDHAKTVNGEIHVDPVNDNRFLRGRQTSDSEGWVYFDTIFPGWYEGRVPHVHVKVITSENEQMSTQFYFDPKLCKEIYTTVAPYDKYGDSPIQLKNDMVLAQGKKADGLMLTVASDPTNTNQLSASAKIGIAAA